MSITCIPTRSSRLPPSKNSRELTREIYGDTIGWLPWRRPGFELGLMLEKFARANPEAVGVVLGSHGLFTWADDPRLLRDDARDHQQGDRLARREDRAASHLRRRGRAPRPSRPKRRDAAAGLMPAIRGLIGDGERKVGHFDDSARRARIRQREPPRRTRRARHLLPRPFPPHQDPPAASSIPTAISVSPRRSPTTGPTTPPITIAASIPTARRCAIPTRSSISCPASA